MASPNRARPMPQLPDFYYHAHFRELIDFVASHYAHALRAADREFIAAFDALSHAAQCLYVRLVNRKGRVFGIGKLAYKELGAPGPLIAELRRAGFVAAPAARDYESLLAALTRAELLSALSTMIGGVRRTLRKAELVALARECLDPSRLAAALGEGRWVAQRRVDSVDYLVYLFFGRLQQGTLRFTMRDLGIVRAGDADADYEPRFTDRDAALESYFFASRRARLREHGDAALAELVREIGRWPEPVTPNAARQANALAERLGRRLEQQGRDDDALAVYRRGDSAACIERQVRILLARGARDAVRDMLETSLDAPRSEEEWLFAHDLYRRTFGGKRTSTLTDALRAADVVTLDQSQSDRPERAVADWFARSGHAAWRAENALWRMLFGLVFWDLLYGDAADARHSPFDALPGGLDDGSFFGRHRDAIDATLAACADRATLQRRIVTTATRHFGAPNAVFGWRRGTLDGVFALARHGDTGAVVAVLRELARDFRGMHGFPDLLVHDADGIRFVEVKAPGDQLRRNQLLRLEQLRAAGFRADVLRVAWCVDPAQPYVVVDVETTGGRGEYHRVTEIGAVRVVDGAVTARFETLVNPERRIPPRISQVTGITDAMVADAPRFAEVADALAEFLDGAIFVAHNVAFDYGFISREFRRLGRAFRMPRLCTCATMRSLFPGHASYSLKALCADFDIPLERHHRALCDAEAAAELLIRINERRASDGVAHNTD